MTAVNDLEMLGFGVKNVEITQYYTVNMGNVIKNSDAFFFCCSLVLPRVTLLSAVTGLNPEPVIVMVVPPYKDPRDGEKPVTFRTYSIVVLTPALHTK